MNGDRDSNLIGRLSVAIASPWMVRHPW